MIDLRRLRHSRLQYQGQVRPPPPPRGGKRGILQLGQKGQDLLLLLLQIKASLAGQCAKIYSYNGNTDLGRERSTGAFNGRDSVWEPPQHP